QRQLDHRGRVLSQRNRGNTGVPLNVIGVMPVNMNVVHVISPSAGSARWTERDILVDDASPFHRADVPAEQKHELLAQRHLGDASLVEHDIHRKPGMMAVKLMQVSVPGPVQWPCPLDLTPAEE